jgi:hypothetical protein
MAVFRTLVLIDGWRRVALQLAQLASIADEELAARLAWANVPRELWDAMRAVVGRHRRYRDVPGLTDTQQRRLAMLTAHLASKPDAAWSNDDRRKSTERERLQARLHGRSVRQINLSILHGTGVSGAATLARVVMPVSLRGLWRAFDEWGARQHGVAVKTFRHWRQTAMASGDPLFATLRRQRVAKAERHRSWPD